jgi:hypothetical protein
VARGSLYGLQFHPEKSAEAGRRLLANFLRLVAAGQSGAGGSSGSADRAATLAPEAR